MPTLVSHPDEVKVVSHIGCCDNSPQQHARRHFEETGHAIICSFEPGEDWFWSFAADAEVEGQPLVPPHAHPIGQPVPGPHGRVPRNWQNLLHP